MPGSYEDINYTLRPAKSVERKMLCEVFGRLSEFGSIKSYRYIGFPSTYFSDFILVHKAWGISDMVGIEIDSHNRDRFEFNLPFRCIKMHFGKSTEVLPTLDWSAKTILWLDYDTPLEGDVLSDVSYFCASAHAGSIILITLDARSGDSEPDQRLATLKKRVGENRVPLDVPAKNLAGWGTAEVYRRILTDRINETLLERNGSRSSENRFRYRQLFYFCYADSSKATMVTVGGLLFEVGQKHLVEKCGFDDFDFVKGGKAPYFIRIPCLTYREIRHIDSQLPRGRDKLLHAPSVPAADVRKYERIYRYFPVFTEAEL